MTLELKTSIDIDATPEQVWAVLSDLGAYEQWNPFIRSASGELVVGGRLDVTMQPPGGSKMRFRPTVKAAQPGRELRWLGRFGLPRVFDGEHSFQIEPRAGGGVRLRHEERFRGVLVPLLARSLRTRTRAGFEAMNEALRERAAAVAA
jgi:hypothetical protein